jgi:enoyl reductase-like protein
MNNKKMEKIKKEVEKLSEKRHLFIKDIFSMLKPYIKNIDESTKANIYIYLDERFVEYGDICMDAVQNVLFGKEE